MIWGPIALLNSLIKVSISPRHPRNIYRVEVLSNIRLSEQQTITLMCTVDYSGLTTELSGS